MHAESIRVDPAAILIMNKFLTHLRELTGM